jgi:hypothetical protein
MSHPEFSPGFRFSAFDAILLVAGALGAWLAWSRISWLGFIVAFVVGHFFLFCNVFRISRSLELIWAAVFLVLTRFTITTGQPTWTTTATLSLALTAVLICIELRKPSYHGVGWDRFNPNLRRWWDTQRTQRDE